jgi:hypothetical protein
MTTNLFKTKTLAIALATFVGTAITVAACKKDKKDVTEPEVNPIELQDYSVNPSLLKTMSGFDNLKITTLISSDDVLPESQTSSLVRSQMGQVSLRIHRAMDL